MELPDRNELEAKYARVMGRLNARMRQRLDDYLGWPPDLTKVPAEFWDELELEIKRQNVAIILLLFTTSADFHVREATLAAPRVGVAGTLQAQADFYASNRAAQLAQRYVATTQTRLRQAAERWEAASHPSPASAPLTPGEAPAAPSTTPEVPTIPFEPPSPATIPTTELTKEAFAKDLESILGASRAATVAVTETTNAQEAGGNAGIAATVGLSDGDLWSTEPELSRSGPCPNCQSLNLKRRKEWATTLLPGVGHEGDPSLGPGAWAVGCCCTTVYANVPGVS